MFHRRTTTRAFFSPAASLRPEGAFSALSMSFLTSFMMDMATFLRLVPSFRFFLAGGSRSAGGTKARLMIWFGHSTLEGRSTDATLPPNKPAGLNAPPPPPPACASSFSPRGNASSRDCGFEERSSAGTGPAHTLGGKCRSMSHTDGACCCPFFDLGETRLLPRDDPRLDWTLPSSSPAFGPCPSAHADHFTTSPSGPARSPCGSSRR
mmetsp:Transcript_77771/g.152214  ORF Transcript_77771/g.152214 Transcript_77771/m.152214 type:complete len:208 (+) Transcript_77771:570-1193(+)